MNNPQHPISPERFSTLVPSSRASPKPTPARKSRFYTISVQRKEQSGRWNQVGSWIVVTEEEDMAGPLRMGLKDNYRILITEGRPPPREEPNGNDS